MFVEGRNVWVHRHRRSTTATGRTIFSGDVTVVRPDSGVSVYRGLVRADFACAPECTAVQHAVTTPLNGAVVAAK